VIPVIADAAYFRLNLETAMYCEACGTRTSENAAHCPACGGPVDGRNPILLGKSQYTTDSFNRDVPNYMARAIVATVLFFWPLGIPAIINAVESKNKIIANDYMGALTSAERSKMWANTSIGVGAGIFSLIMVACFFIAMADSL